MCESGDILFLLQALQANSKPSQFASKVPSWENKLLKKIMSPVVIARQIFFKLRKDYQVSFKSFRKIKRTQGKRRNSLRKSKETEMALPLKGSGAHRIATKV